MSLILLLDRPAAPPPLPPPPPPVVYSLTINGVPKKLQPGWAISEAANWRNTLSCEVLSLDASYRAPIDGEIVITENGTRIFGGIIQIPSENGIGDRNFTGITTRISASDFNIFAERRQIDLDITSTTLKAVLQTLVTYLTPYGVTLDPGQVVGPILPNLSYRPRKLNEAFDEIAMLAQGYIWEIDYNKVLRMFVPGSATAPFGVFETEKNVEGDISVEPSRTDYANSVILMAGTGTKDVADLIGTGDGIVREYQVHYKPRSFYVVNVGGTFANGWVTGGVNETVGTPPAIWFHEPNANVLIRNAPLPRGVGNVYALMNAQFPLRIVKNSGAPPSSLVEKIITEPDVFDYVVAQTLAQAYLDRSMLTPRTVRYTTARRDIHPGQTQAINVPKRNLSGGFLITDVRITNTAANFVRRSVTAVEGSTLPETWRDSFRQWTGGSGAATASPSGAVTVVTSGGVGGSGAPGRIPKWITSSVLGDSMMTDSGAVLSIAGLLTAIALSGNGDGLTNLRAEQLTGRAPVSVLNLAGYSLADIGTRNASDLNLGNLDFLRLPAGTGTWTVTLTISGALNVTGSQQVTGAMAAADIRLTVNNTPYKARNAAGTADLPLISGDDSNRTALHLNSARLRFATPSTGAAPGGSALGVLNVTIDGVGDVAIPYY